MAMRLVVFTCVLSTIIPQSVSAYTSTTSVERQPESSISATQLQSSPELMTCSVDRAQVFWQDSTLVNIDAVPCQYWSRIGGPAEDLAGVNPIKLEDTETSITLDRRTPFPELEQPLDLFNPRPSNYLQLLGPNPLTVPQGLEF